MTDEQFERAVALLAEARRTRTQLPGLPAELCPPDAATAYRVAAAVARRLGWSTAGWKIAGTNPDMRRRLRLAEPIRGRVFEGWIADSPWRVERALLLSPLLECEFVVRLGADLPPRGRPWTRGDVAAAVAAVHPGIEVAETRYANAGLPPVPGVLADGSGSGTLVLGPALPDWRAVDLAAARARILAGGVERGAGAGGDVMGHPFESLAWLAAALAAEGDWLRAGQFVSTGSCTGMLPGRAGTAYEGVFTAGDGTTLGTVRIDLT